jgi:hypothetical protein
MAIQVTSRKVPTVTATIKSKPKLCSFGCRRGGRFSCTAANIFDLFGQRQPIEELALTVSCAKGYQLSLLSSSATWPASICNGNSSTWRSQAIGHPLFPSYWHFRDSRLSARTRMCCGLARPSRWRTAASRKVYSFHSSVFRNGSRREDNDRLTVAILTLTLA